MQTEVPQSESQGGNPRQQVAELLAAELGMGESLETPETNVPEETEQEQELSPIGEVESGGEEKAEGEQEAGDEIKTLTDLANAIEVDPEFLYSLSLPMSDGAEPVSLGEIKDRLQEANRTESLRTQLENERSALQKEKEGWAQQLGQIQQQALAVPKAVEEARGRLYALASAWKYLEENQSQFDAGQLALRRNEIQTETAEAQNVLNQAMQQYQAEQQQLMRTRLTENAQKILGKIPEWRDQKVALEGRAKIGQVLTEYGFGANEVDGLYDHRLIVMLRDFSELKEQLVRAKEMVGKGRKVPKVLNAGASPSRKTVSKKALQEKLEAARKSRNLRQKASAVSDLLNGSM